MLFVCAFRGYGNNAVEMETTATWDDKTKEFIINSPSVLSQKYWITNSAVHAKWAGKLKHGGVSYRKVN